MGSSREKFAVKFGSSLHIDRLCSRALAFAVLDDDFSTSQDDVLAYWFIVHDSHQEELEKHVVDLKEDLFFFPPSIEVEQDGLPSHEAKVSHYSPAEWTDCDGWSWSRVVFDERELNHYPEIDEVVCRSTLPSLLVFRHFQNFACTDLASAFLQIRILCLLVSTLKFEMHTSQVIEETPLRIRSDVGDLRSLGVELGDRIYGILGDTEHVLEIFRSLQLLNPETIDSIRSWQSLEDRFKKNLKHRFESLVEIT
jgi:hypothetical protein